MARSVHSHSFSEIPRAEIQRSSFDRSHGHKTTFDAGRLIPFFLEEALPGDTFNVRTAGFVRMATPIFPIMDNMYMDTHYFFVPNRLVWDNWHKFMGEIEDPQIEDPQNPIQYLVPIANPPEALEAGDIGDYMGLPIGKTGVEVSALFHRAYRLIYDEWFRDENLQDPIMTPEMHGDGPDNGDSYQTKTAIRGKRFDYFTSALLWPQKGPDVNIGLAGQASVHGIGMATQAYTNLSNEWFETGDTSGGGAQVGESQLLTGNDESPHHFIQEDPENPGYPNIYAQLDEAGAVSINQLREAFQIQKMYERDARGGTRYTEIIKAHFGVTSPDARLQRPEYLGGGTTPINVNPINSTAETDPTGGPEGRILGALSAVVTGAFTGHGFSKSFTEHGIVIGLVSVRADLTYQQGIPRMFNRSEKFDFYWPALAHLGEQEILNQELFYSNDAAVDTEVFGYQERFAEYRYAPSKITGIFRSDHPTSLDAWHLSEDFTVLPTLSEEFIRHEPPLDRVIAVTDEPHFIADFWHQFRCARPMPMYGVPGNIDRF